jgi:hypothetical protein
MSPIKKAALIVGITLPGMACHTMRPVEVHELSGLRPGVVRVTRTDDAVVEIAGPKIVGDRLGGFVDGKYQVLPVADVKQMQMRVPARGRTVALISAGVVGAVAITYLLSGAGEGGDPCSGQSSDCDPGSVNVD